MIQRISSLLIILLISTISLLSNPTGANEDKEIKGKQHLSPSSALPVVKVPPKSKDYSETIKVNGAYPESRVTITVGEKNGFSYTVNGITYSDKKIAVSGEYFNDEPNRYGYTRLFLVIDTGISYYALRPQGNMLDVFIRNYDYNEFFYTIYCPQPVTAYDLHEGQINATAVLITGPSRSSAYYPRLKKVTNLIQEEEA